MLKTIQKNFFFSVFDKEGENLQDISSTDAEERFNVYRQTVIQNLQNALTVAFPCTWKLLGPKCADSAAYRFLKKGKNGPETGCLDDWGESFPEFLESVPEFSKFSYLGDFARYEWLKQEAYCSSPDGKIQPPDLNGLSEEQIGQAKIQFVSSVQLFFSDYPIDQIQDLIDEPTTKNITLRQGGACAIIARINNTVKTFWLSASQYAFIGFLLNNCSLGNAIESTIRKYGSFNLEETLYLLLHAGVVKKIIV